MVDNTKKTHFNELFKRVISALVLIPLAIFFVYVGGNAFTILVSLVGCGMLIELYRMIKSKKLEFSQKLLWGFCSVIYTALPCFSFIYLRLEALHGIIIIMWLLFSVWATDIGAYIVGTVVKGPKIWPKISPKKTWAGLVGGMLCAVIIGYFFDILSPHFKYRFIYLSPIIAVIAQVGDFLESAIKRYFGFKDSGNLIPGHGGILDRVDGLVISSLFIFLLEFCV